MKTMGAGRGQLLRSNFKPVATPGPEPHKWHQPDKWEKKVHRYRHWSIDLAPRAGGRPGEFGRPVCGAVFNMYDQIGIDSRLEELDLFRHAKLARDELTLGGPGNPKPSAERKVPALLKSRRIASLPPCPTCQRIYDEARDGQAANCHGKRRYETQLDAELALAQIRAREVRSMAKHERSAYRCPGADHWHLTSQS